MDPNERRLISSIASHRSWAETPDRAARTAPARRALDEKFLAEAEGDPARAEQLRKAHFRTLALESARVRRANRTECETERYVDALADALASAPPLSSRQRDRLADLLRGGAA